MRKTCLYYDSKQQTLLENEQTRLKTLTAMYPQLYTYSQTPTKFNPRQNYILLTNSQSTPVFPIGLIAIIVYCMKLDKQKIRQIQRKYQREYQQLKLNNRRQMPKLIITNNFNEVVINVVKQLGYQYQVQGIDSKNYGSNNQISYDKNDKNDVNNRFSNDKAIKQELKNTAEMVIKQEIINSINIKQIIRALKLDLNFYIEKVQIKTLSQILQKQLKNYLKSKQIQPLDKQFIKFKQSKTLVDLCRACLHFYTLQKYSLYHNLNFLLRNVRSIVFREQLQKLKIFAFLLILNYLFVYSGSYGMDDHSTPPALYRYTDSIIDPELTGKIVTVPSFYSVSSRDDNTQFQHKQTKIIVCPLIEGNSSISLSSLFPIHTVSAFKKQQEYLYIPFTCFLVTQIRYKKSQQKWIVNLKQIPGNPIIKRVLDINLFQNQQKDTVANLTDNKLSQALASTADWQLKYQQRYQYSNDPINKIKTSFNLGLIFLRMIEKYQIAANYFIQGIQLVNKNIKNREVNSMCLLVKGCNYLGLAYLKNNQLQKCQQTFKQAQKKIFQLQKLIQSSKNDQYKDKMKYLRAAFINNQALLLQNQSNYPQAVNKYKQALTILSGCIIKNQLMQACILSNIGAIVGRCDQNNKQNQSGFQYLCKAFLKYLDIYGIIIVNKLDTVIDSPTKSQNQITLENNNPQTQIQHLLKYIKQHKILISELIPVLQNCSTLYQLRSDIPKSTQFQQQSISLYLSLNIVHQNQSSTLLFMKSRLASLMIKQQKYMKSIKIYEQMLPIARLIDQNNIKTATIKSNIAAAYFNIGQNQQLQKALFWYNQAIKDISQPLLSQNMGLYNRLCDIREDIKEYLKTVHKKY